MSNTKHFDAINLWTFEHRVNITNLFKRYINVIFLSQAFKRHFMNLKRKWSYVTSRPRPSNEVELCDHTQIKDKNIMEFPNDFIVDVLILYFVSRAMF